MTDAKERLKKIMQKERRVQEERELSKPKPPSRPSKSIHGIPFDDVDNPFREDSSSSSCINLEEDNIHDIHTIATVLPSPPSERAVSGCECNYCAVS